MSLRCGKNCEGGQIWGTAPYRFRFLDSPLISMQYRLFLQKAQLQTEGSANCNVDIKTPLIYLRRRIPEQVERCDTYITKQGIVTRQIMTNLCLPASPPWDDDYFYQGVSVLTSNFQFLR